MCRLLMKHAECSNHFEGLNEIGERCITTKLSLIIEVSYIDESRCSLKGIRTKEFTVNAGDWIELENKNGETVVSIIVKDINLSAVEHRTKDNNIIVQGGCAADILFDFVEYKGFIDIRDK